MPGTAATLAQAFAAGLRPTRPHPVHPDMMPGDALGTNLFNFQTNTLPPTKGLVFTQILLADDQPHAQDPGRLLRP